MLYRSFLSVCRHARRACGNVPLDRARLCAAAAVPLGANAPMPVDTSLFGLVVGLAVIAGLSVGIVYRYLHGQIETLRARLGNSEAELRTLLTVTDEAILVLDANGVIRAMNPAAEELFGRSTDDLVGGEMAEVIPQPFALADVTRHGPISVETFAIRPGEDKTPVEIVLSPVELAEGRSYLLLTRPRSVAGGKPAMADPIAKYCHDLNNHLTGVLGGLSMLLVNAGTDSATRERLTNAKRAGLKAQETVRKVQALAKGDETPRESSGGTIVPMPQASPSQMGRSIARVLVLDDEPAIRGLVSAALETMGYEIVEKEDGTSAVQAVEEALKSGRRFNLVISDLTLPGELDGCKAVGRMRAIDPELKAIISTGYDQDPVMLQHRDYGFAAAIPKPFEMGHLIRVVGEVLATESSNRKSA